MINDATLRSELAEILRQVVNRSNRKREIVQLLALGRTEWQIASELGISAATVHTHIQSLYQILRVTDRLRLGVVIADSFPLPGLVTTRD